MAENAEILAPDPPTQPSSAATGARPPRPAGPFQPPAISTAAAPSDISRPRASTASPSTNPGPPRHQQSPLLSDKALLRAALENFYREFNPANVPRVDEFLSRYSGREAQLIRDIEEKYQDRNVKLLNYAPRSTQAAVPSREDVGMAALPALLLNAFSKSPASGSSKDGAVNGSSSATPPRTTPTSSSASPSGSRSPPEAPKQRAGGGSQPAPDSADDEKAALVRDKATLMNSAKALQARLDSKVAECSSLERKLKDSVRQGEALQRNLLTVMDKELSMHKRGEELEKRLAVVEARVAAAEKERDEAVAARAASEQQLRETVSFQHLLASQLHSLIQETNLGFDPYHPSSSGFSCLDGHPRPPRVSPPTVVSGLPLETSLAATRAELALVLRSREELEARAGEMQRDKAALEAAVRGLKQRLEEEGRRSARLTEGLESAQRDVADRVKAVEEYEAALREEKQGRAAVEAQLREAQAVIDAAAKTRREMEGFCRQFRKDVEAAASERVTQALSLSAMSLEDMLSRQAGLLDLHRQLHQDERQAYQDEIRRLTKSLFESRKQHAYSDKQAELLKQELHKAAEELVQLKQKLCMAGDHITATSRRPPDDTPSPDDVPC